MYCRDLKDISNLDAPGGLTCDLEAVRWNLAFANPAVVLVHLRRSSAVELGVEIDCTIR